MMPIVYNIYSVYFFSLCYCSFFILHIFVFVFFFKWIVVLAALKALGWRNPNQSSLGRLVGGKGAIELCLRPAPPRCDHDPSMSMSRDRPVRGDFFFRGHETLTTKWSAEINK